MTATTALTAQNTLGVKDIHHTPPAFLQKQVDAVCEDVGVDVVKTGNLPGGEMIVSQLTLATVGMLASAEVIDIVAGALRRFNIGQSVVDPVCWPDSFDTHHTLKVR
jgi:hydroxymethylpyrimidine/phosphomethylpyrimidine kinase